MFIDKAQIKILSGSGGNGAVAWRREKYVDKGGPSGGDGGRGGDVYLVASENLSTLLDFKYKSKFDAQSGENGQKKNCHGKCGKDLFIKVPLGTIVRDISSGKVIGDLKHHDQKLLIAKGGEEEEATPVLQLQPEEPLNFANPENPALKGI
jgi:GTP-binding protein